MPAWILAVIAASIALTGVLTWVLYRINHTQARGRLQREGDDLDAGDVAHRGDGAGE